MKKVLYIFVILSAGFSAAQNKYVDSVLQVIFKAKNDSVRGWNYIDLAHATVNSNPFVSKLYGTKAKELFKKANNTSGLAHACLRLATATRMLNEESEMLSNVKEALSIAEKTSNNELLASCYHEMALISNVQNDVEKSLAYNLKALNMRLKMKSSDRNEHEISGLYNNIGIEYARREDWVNGVKYFKLAIAHDEKTKNVYGLGNSLNNIGIYYIVTLKYDSAMHYLMQAKKFREQIYDRLGQSGSYNNLAALHMHMKKFKEALAYADSSYKIALELKNVAQEDETLITYYEIYNALKDYKMALHYFLLHDAIRKKMDAEGNNRRLAEMQSSVTLELKQNEISKFDLQLKASEAESRKRTFALIFSIAIIAVAGFFIWYILKVNAKMKSANALIKQQKRQTDIQKKIIEEKHKDITDSIDYAQKIQESLLIPEVQLKKSIPDSFILYRPRDVVSGDFYWFAEKNGAKILAVADCTGHGIPGAFMSLIGISSLNQIVIENEITSPAEILNLLREQIIKSFNQRDEESHRRDGMDIGLIKIQEGKITFAGANNPCLLLRNNEIISFTADKQPVGFHEHATTFNETDIPTQKGDTFYLFSDGVVDQFGGPKGKKLKIKYFKEWLLESSAMNLADQKKFIEGKLIKWKASFDQTDDILIAGIKC